MGKVITTVSIDPSLKENAKLIGLNISQVLDEALAARVGSETLKAKLQAELFSLEQRAKEIRVAQQDLRLKDELKKSLILERQAKEDIEKEQQEKIIVLEEQLNGKRTIDRDLCNAVLYSLRKIKAVNRTTKLEDALSMFDEANNDVKFKETLMVEWRAKLNER